eukprot:1083707-Amphidinium_carterae.1
MGGSLAHATLMQEESFLVRLILTNIVKRPHPKQKRHHPSSQRGTSTTTTTKTSLGNVLSL